MKIKALLVAKINKLQLPPATIVARRMLTLIVIVGMALLALQRYSLEKQNSALTSRIISLSKLPKVAGVIDTPKDQLENGAKNGLLPVEKGQVVALLEQIRKVALVPEDEPPSLATVVDEDKLREQSFFRNVLNGDKLFLYSKGRLAVLYRPTIGKIVNMSALVDPESASPTPQPTTPTPVATAEATPTPAEKIKVAIRFTDKAGDYIKEVKEAINAIADVEILEDIKATKDDYKGVTAVDFAGTHTTSIDAVKSKVSVTVGPLPEGEASPSADLLFIVGEKQ